MNLFPAEVAGRSARLAGGTVDLGADYGTPKGRVQVGIRPEY